MNQRMIVVGLLCLIGNLASSVYGQEKLITSEYTVFRFHEIEGWRCTTYDPVAAKDAGSAGTSGLRQGKWTFDFSQGASWLGLVPRDIALPGTPKQMRIRLRGSTGGRGLRLRLMSLIQAFERTVPVPAGDGEHELVFPLPPAEGWQWFGGHNDGQIRGPLRIAGLFLDAGEKKDRGELELLDIRVEATCPADRMSILTAELRGDGAERQFVATLRSMTPKPFEGTLTCVVRDWDERQVATHKRKQTVYTDGPVYMTVPVPTNADPFLEAKFTLKAAEELGVTTCWVAPLKREGNNQLDPSSPFGMGLYLDRYPNTPAGLKERDRAVDLARAAGVKWSRELFYWPCVEPEKGKYDWSINDTIVNTAKREGISVFGVLAGWSPWTKPYTQEGITDYCRFAEEVVRRYRKDVHVWEIWNEPNIFFWEGPKDMYADLLKSAYAAIKKADPNARVAGCSTAEIDNEFIKRTLALGADFDILSIHPYRQSLNDREFIKDLYQAAALVRRPDGSARDVWITEMGWGTQMLHNTHQDYWGPVSERQQAELLARTYIDALASGIVSNITWYDFRCDGPSATEWEFNLGILRHDLSPKPAYRAFATVTSMLAGRPQCQELDLGPYVLAFQFSDEKGARPVTALWGLVDAREVSLPADAPVVLTNLMGQSRTLVPAEEKVIVPVQHLCPVFLSYSNRDCTSSAKMRHLGGCTP